MVVVVVVVVVVSGGAATGCSTAAGGGGGVSMDEELKDQEYYDILGEFENKLFYAEDGFNEDLADAERSDEGVDEEDDRGPDDVWELFGGEGRAGSVGGGDVGGESDDPTEYSTLMYCNKK